LRGLRRPLRTVKRDACAQQRCCRGVTDVVHAKVRQTHVGRRRLPSFPEGDGLPFHATFEHQLVEFATLEHPLQQLGRLCAEEEDARRAVLGHWREDLAPLEVDVRPPALEQLRLARAGVDQQRNEDSEATVAKGERAGAKRVDLLALEVDPADPFVEAADIERRAAKAPGRDPLLACPTVGAAERREVAIDRTGLVAMLEHGLGRVLELLGGDRPGRKVTEGRDPLAQARVGAVAPGDGKTPDQFSQGEIDGGFLAASGLQGGGQVEDLAHFGSPRRSLP
jgi:hypothetical protein